MLISDSTFGNTGIQLQHNSGTPRAHIGKGNGEGFKFDGTNIIMSSSKFMLGSKGSANSYISSSGNLLEISSKPETGQTRNNRNRRNRKESKFQNRKSMQRSSWQQFQ